MGNASTQTPFQPRLAVSSMADAGEPSTTAGPVRADGTVIAAEASSGVGTRLRTHVNASTIAQPTHPSNVTAVSAAPSAERYRPPQSLGVTSVTLTHGQALPLWVLTLSYYEIGHKDRMDVVDSLHTNARDAATRAHAAVTVTSPRLSSRPLRIEKVEGGLRTAVTTANGTLNGPLGEVLATMWRTQVVL